MPLSGGQHRHSRATHSNVQPQTLPIEGNIMIARYTRPELGRIWSEENKYRCWLTVEVAASQALAKFGLVPQSAADTIRDRGAFTVARINEIEAEVRHDVIAFTTTVAEHINDPEQ